MFYTYVLKSLSANHYYIGYTNDLEQRLKYHNSGKVNWTRQYVPWKIIYNEQFKNKDEAIRREKYLKSHAGRNWLKKNIVGS